MTFLIMDIPDPVEIMSNRAENWAYDNIRDSRFLCGCGKWCDLKDAKTLSPNPYAIPVCPNCCEEHIEKINSKNR